jgi:DNA-binding GntR family transcriptional regulator
MKRAKTLERDRQARTAQREYPPSLAANDKVDNPKLVASSKLPNVLGFELVSAIEQQIIYLDLEPGAHLIEQEVCNAFGVSRSPVREAFRQLEAGGLVVRYQRRGVRVTPMTETDFNNIQECRAPLEAIAAAEAAQNAASDDIAEMQLSIDMMRKAQLENNVRNFFGHNIHFFEVMHRAAKNDVLLRILSVIEKQASRYRYLAHIKNNAMMPFVFKGDSEIFQAISSRKPGLARSATLSVMVGAQDIIVDVLRHNVVDKSERELDRSGPTDSPLSRRIV